MPGKVIVSFGDGDCYFLKFRTVELCRPPGTGSRFMRGLPELHTQESFTYQPVQVKGCRAPRKVHGGGGLVTADRLPGAQDVLKEPTAV